jgi:hypothetical protein
MIIAVILHYPITTLFHHFIDYFIGSASWSVQCAGSGVEIRERCSHNEDHRGRG